MSGGTEKAVTFDDEGARDWRGHLLGQRAHLHRRDRVTLARAAALLVDVHNLGGDEASIDGEQPGIR